MTTAMTQQRKRATYRAYKPSGLMWLEDVPSMWPISRLRFQVKINPVKSEIRGIPQDTSVSFVPMEAVGEYGGLRLEQTHALEDVANGYTYFRDGDVVVAKITPCFENGKGSIADGLENGIGFGTTELHVLRPSSFIDRNYLFYLTISHAFRKIGASYMYGAGGQKRVPDTFIRDFRHPIPTTNEQRSIAAFLDRETARIDALIEKKRCQIELLQEKRSALISHAVTKGLNPNAKMKDSGIEWLGKIPAHWESFDIKRVVIRVQTGCTPPTTEQRYYENGTVPWYGPGSFGEHVVLSEPVKLLNESAVRDGAARLFAADSVMIVSIGATIGKVGYLVTAASSNQQITAVIPNPKKASGKFLAYQLKRLEPVLRGIAPSTTLPIMDQQEVGVLPCALPSLQEQKRIVEYLDAQTVKIEAMVSRIQYSIDLLREYRTALISAAVTGKIDVQDSIEKRPKQFKRG